MKNKEKKSIYQSQRLSTKQMTRIALMVAFVSAMSYIRIPLPLSDAAITGQTLAVNVIALLLIPKEAFITMLCYWLLGLVGAPVFGGMAGPGKMFGPGGGYFVAFMLAVVLIGTLKGKTQNMARHILVTILVGILVIDGIGFVWLKIITGMTWKASFLAGVVAFVPLDLVKCVLACVIARPLRRAMNHIE